MTLIWIYLYLKGPLPVECGLGIFKGSRIRMAGVQLPAPVLTQTPTRSQQTKSQKKTFSFCKNTFSPKPCSFYWWQKGQVLMGQYANQEKKVQCSISSGEYFTKVIFESFFQKKSYYLQFLIYLYSQCVHVIRLYCIFRLYNCFPQIHSKSTTQKN